MTGKNLLIQRNGVRQLIEMNNRHKNVLKWGANETEEHIQMKLEICKYLRKNKEEFYSEAIFTKGRGRADIVSADRGLIIEVVNSEKEASIIAKQLKYPLPLIVVNANQKFKEELIL